MPVALAAAALFASASPGALQGPDVAQLLRDACVTTELQRTAFERMARERGWREARTTSRSGPQGGWSLFFHADGAVVMLSYVPEVAADEPSTGTVCTVSVEQATPQLEAEIGSLAEELGLEEEQPFTGPQMGAASMQTWSRLGYRTLTYAVVPNGRASISLSRQVVVHVPAQE